MGWLGVGRLYARGQNEGGVQVLMGGRLEVGLQGATWSIGPEWRV